MKRLALAIASLGLIAAAAMAAEKPQSGPATGSRILGYAFDVVDVSGPRKGNQLCYY